MENIINRLIHGDTEGIQQATAELTESFKNPEAIPALCQVTVSSQNPQFRQYAAILLRKRLAKAKNWILVPQDMRNNVKSGMLNALVNEKEHMVKTAIAQFIGILVKHEFPTNTWPELLQFIQELCASEAENNRELGMFTISVMIDMAPAQYITHINALCQLCSSQLESICPESSVNILFYALVTLTKLIPVLEGHDAANAAYKNMLPACLQALRFLAERDPAKCIVAMEFLDDLAESAPAIIVPHMQFVVELSLQFASNQQLQSELRVKATSIIGWLVRIKRKSLIKNQLIGPIVEVLFKLMSSPSVDDSDEDYFVDDADNANPLTCATQTMDSLALHLPPEKLLPHILNHVQPALQGDNPYYRRGAFLCLAVISEGCAEAIRAKYLPNMLRCIGQGVTDTNAVVRNAALFALGQFSEYLQPDISQYASDILPILFEFLSQLCATLPNNSEPPSIDKMFYALEVFCEHLEDSLIPYLDTFMERLFVALDFKNSAHLRELSLSAIAAAANAAKEAMLPYFPRIVEGLKVYLTMKPEDETSISLQAQAIDTFGALARTIGKDNFMPFASESLQHGLTLIEENNDPNLRRSVFGLFAALSTVMNGQIGPALPKIVELMTESIKSSEGIVHYYGEGEKVTNLLTDESLDKALSYISSPKSWSVENDYIDEKEQACLALKEIAEFAGEVFNPYLEGCFEEIFKLTNYPQEDIRKAALCALGQFCISISFILTPEFNTAKEKVLSVLIPKCSEIIRTDEEKGVVIEAVETFDQILDKCHPEMKFADVHRDAIFNCILDVFTGKLVCQDADDRNDDSSVEDQAEQDEMLIEYAGDVLPKLGKHMKSDDFLIIFMRILPHILSRTKKSCSLSQRSFAIGLISECMAPLQQYVANIAPQLLPLLLQFSKDPKEDVRNNAIFGVGEMMLHGKELLYPHYPEVLSTPSSAVSQKTHAGTLDNICGALARMISTNMNGVPLEQVMPVFVQYLPLRHDFEENLAVYRCLQTLFTAKHPNAIEQVGAILKASAETIHRKQWSNDETMELVINVTRALKQEYPEQYQAVLPYLDVELSDLVKQL
uniref:Putative karyopherin importin beta 3 n=1 Tax=Xenopsylla cheopis TaxID=163159 RepID=A0A6M2DTC3_XENCH